MVGHRSPRRGFTVSWEGLKCSEVNADAISEFLVRYRLAGTGAGQAVSRIALSSPFVIENDSLATLTPYEVEVAAINTLATGPYSMAVQAVILAGQFSPEIL